MSQNEFAAAIGISAASLSSIINGHNNPTTKYVFAIHDRFPEISVNWLMFGEGEMINGDAKAAGADTKNNAAPDAPAARTQDMGSLFTQMPPAAAAQQAVMPATQPYEREMTSPQTHRSDAKNLDKPQRRIKEIRIFFDDNTFEVFKGNIA